MRSTARLSRIDRALRSLQGAPREADFDRIMTALIRDAWGKKGALDGITEEDMARFHRMRKRACPGLAEAIAKSWEEDSEGLSP